MSSRALSSRSWTDVQAMTATDLLLVVPVGSCEQHGPHLPFDVDTSVARHVAERLVGLRPEALLAPALEYGASGEHQGFAGTLSLGTEILTAVLVELGRSASTWAPRVLFVTGHGGNVEALVDAVSKLRSEGRDAAWWPCAVPGGDAHAGRSETSMLMALRPESVVQGRVRSGTTTPLRALMPALRLGGILAVSPSGVLGDPSGASDQEGRVLLEGLAGRLSREVDAWEVRADGRLEPSIPRTPPPAVRSQTVPT